MASLKTRQRLGKIGRRTGSNIIPAERVIGKASDGTELFKDYWTDSDHSDENSDIAIPSPKSPRLKIQAKKGLGRRTGAKALSGKRMKLKEDGTEEFDHYWTDRESVADSSFVTRTSSSTAASNLTRRSSLRRSSTNFSNLRDSFAPEKTVHDKSCNTSGPFKDKLILTTHRSTNAATETHHHSQKLVSPNSENHHKDLEHSSPDGTPQKSILSSSKYFKNKRNRSFDNSVKKYDFNGAENNTSALRNHSQRSSPSKRSQYNITSPSFNNSVREHDFNDAENNKSASRSHSRRSSPRKNSQNNITSPSFNNSVREHDFNDAENNKSASRSHSRRSSPRKNSQNNITSPSKSPLNNSIAKSRVTDEQFDRNEQKEIGSANKNNSYMPNQTSNEISPKKVNSPTFSPASPLKSSLRDPYTPRSNIIRKLTFEEPLGKEQDDMTGNEITSTKVKNFTSTIEKTNRIHPLRSSPRKSTQKNTPSSPKTDKNAKIWVSETSDSEGEFKQSKSNERNSTRVQNKNPVGRPRSASSKMSANSMKYSFLSSPKKISQTNKKLSSEDSSAEEEDGIEDNEVITSKTLTNKKSSLGASLRSSPRKSLQRNSSVNEMSKVTSTRTKNASNGPHHFSSEHLHDSPKNIPSFNKSKRHQISESSSEDEYDNKLQERHSTSTRSAKTADTSHQNSRKKLAPFNESGNKVTPTSVINSYRSETNFDGAHHSAPTKNSPEKILRTSRSLKEPVSDVEPSNETSKPRRITMKIFTKNKNKLVVEDISDDENEISPVIESQEDKHPKVSGNKVISPKNKNRLQRQNRVSENKSDDQFDNDKESEKASTNRRMSYRSTTNSSVNKKTSLNETSKKKNFRSTPGSSRNNYQNFENVSNNMVQEEIVSARLRDEAINDNSYRVSKNLGTRSGNLTNQKLVNYSDDESYTSSNHNIASSDNSQKKAKARSREVSTKLNRSSKKRLPAEVLESDSENDAISLMRADGPVAPAKSRHLSSNQLVKDKEINKSTTSNVKRKTVEPHYPEAESNISKDRESKSHADMSRESLKSRNSALQRSRKKSRIVDSDLDDDLNGIAAGSAQYSSPEAPTKLKKLNRTNSSKSKHNLVGKAVSDPQNEEQELEVNDLDLEIKTKKKRKTEPKNKPKTEPKKKRKIEMPSDQPRRSDRQRIAPLKFWANERQSFAQNCRTGEIKNLGVIEGTGVDDSCQKALDKRQKKYQIRKEMKKSTRMKKMPPTSVLNKCKSREEKVVLHMLYDYMNWDSMHAKDGGNVNPAYYLSKPFSSESITFGVLKICPKEKKPSQVSPNGNVHFFIVKGGVKVKIHETVREFKRYDCFIVPKHQPYSVENVGYSEALIAFCAFQQPFFKYQFEE